MCYFEPRALAFDLYWLVGRHLRYISTRTNSHNTSKGPSFHQLCCLKPTNPEGSSRNQTFATYREHVANTGTVSCFVFNTILERKQAHPMDNSLELESSSMYMIYSSLLKGNMWGIELPNKSRWEKRCKFWATPWIAAIKKRWWCNHC
jgi:hypothetical protein